MLARAAILGLIMLWPGLAVDDLPPGILLLSRIKRHMREELERLPDYTCLQTALRYRNRADQPDDTVVLEVLYAGSKELYGSPGARDSWHEDPGSFTAGGMSGNGTFGLHLHNLFVNDVAMFQYRGEEEVAGRRAVRYDYRIPLLFSGFTIYLGKSQGRVSMRGSVWADPETLDLLRFDDHAEDIPANLPLVSATQSVDYARTRIGDRDVLLPQSATIGMLQTSGEESRNALEFTHCQAFAAESKLSFDAPEPGAPGSPAPKAPASVAPPLPAGLPVTIELAAPITERDTVGSIVEGRLSADVLEKGKIVVPAGARVRGRIRRLERHTGDNYYVVALEFTHIETARGTARFYAIFDDIDKRANVKLALSTVLRGAQTEQTYLMYLPGVASFFVTGPHLELPTGFRTKWKTKSPR